MKKVLMIGMGKFGRHLCDSMSKLGNELMVVDVREEVLEELVSKVMNVRIGDCTSEKFLKSLDVGSFDICIVCIGSNFQSSLEITSLLKEMGAKYVISKANRDIHAKFLLRNGADEVIYPNRDIAQRLAVRLSANHVLTISSFPMTIRFMKYRYIRTGSDVRSAILISEQLTRLMYWESKQKKTRIFFQSRNIALPEKNI